MQGHQRQEEEYYNSIRNDQHGGFRKMTRIVCTDVVKSVEPAVQFAHSPHTLGVPEVLSSLELH